MEITIEKVAALIDGTVEGRRSATVNRLEKIEEATPGSITFLANPKYIPYFYTTRATAVIVSNDFEPEKDFDTNLIRVKDPYSAFAILLETYQQMTASVKTGIESPSFQSESATIGKNAYLGAFSYLGDSVRLGNNVKIYPNSYVGDHVEIGDNTVIYAGVKIYTNCKVGANCVVQAGAVIGGHGFGFAPQQDGTYKAIPQTGNVIIENNVDIGANTTIDCATIGATILREGVKIDNLVQIAHNVTIGENTVIAGQSGISGSTRIGKNCVIAGQVGISGHLDIADNTTFGPQSGVVRNVKENGKSLMGCPAIEAGNFFKSSIYFRDLTVLFKKVRELEKKL